LKNLADAYSPMFESWIVTENEHSPVQVAEIGFLRRIYWVTLRNKLGSREISKSLYPRP